MRAFFASALILSVLMPATAQAVEPCPDPDLGIYMESRLRAGLRPSHRCTENQARYLRGLYGDAQRAYARRLRQYTEWLQELEQNDTQPADVSSDTRSSRRTYRTIRRR